MSLERSRSEDRATTQEWLEGILDGYFRHTQPNEQHSPKVLEWEITPACNETEGCLSEILALDISFEAAGEIQRTKLIAKLLPRDPSNKAFVIETLFDLREIKFYTEIRPALEELTKKLLPDGEFRSIDVPECYHAVHKEGSESIIVLADLRVQGFDLQPLSMGLTRKQADAALECLAEVHAASYAIQVNEKVSLREKFPYLLTTDQAVESFQGLVDRGLPLLLKFIQPKSDFSAIRECLQGYSGGKASDTFRKILSPSKKLNTLVHCDFWCNNLLFKKEGEKVSCRMIDWQMVTSGSPAIDLAMLVSTSLSPQVRKSHQEDIVISYWNIFTNRARKMGIKLDTLNYNVDELLKDVREAQALAALLVVGSIDIALGSTPREDRVLNLLTDLIEQGVL